MPRGQRIVIEDVHRALWERTDGRRCIRVSAELIMGILNCTKYTASRVVKELTNEGRIDQITKRKYRMGVFRVSDPDDFDQFVSNGET